MSKDKKQLPPDNGNDPFEQTVWRNHLINKKDVIITNFTQEIEQMIELKEESKLELMEHIAQVDHFLNKKIKAATGL